jgi:hypothetical protein
MEPNQLLPNQLLPNQLLLVLFALAAPLLAHRVTPGPSVRWHQCDSRVERGSAGAGAKPVLEFGQ